MYGLVGRNAGVVGATVAAVLLIVQLHTGGIDNYAPADVLSILLIAVPVATQALRPSPQRRRPAHRPGQVDGGGDEATRGRRAPSRIDTEVARAVERMLARGIAMVIALGAWLLAVVLVLLQAWAPAASALIVFGVAVAGIPVQDEDAPVASSPGNSRG